MQNACNDRVHHQVAGWAYLPVAWYVNLTRDGNPGVQFERTPVLCPKPGDAQDEDFGRVGTGLHVSSSFMPMLKSRGATGVRQINRNSLMRVLLLPSFGTISLTHNA